jgi:hypothetical protein
MGWNAARAPRVGGGVTFGKARRPGQRVIHRSGASDSETSRQLVTRYPAGRG